jgi:putative DNA methylase
MPQMENVATRAEPTWRPEGEIAKRMTGGNCTPYGLVSWGDLFTPRQLVALTTLSDLVLEARERVKRDALATGLLDDGESLPDVRDAAVYADGVAVYLALSTDRLADRNSSLCGWDLAQAARGREATVRNVFARQALPMMWDFVEVNVLAETAGSYDSALRAVVRVVECFSSRADAQAFQVDAASQNLTGC